MSDTEDYYLSDIHVENTSFMNETSQNDFKTSRVEFVLPNKSSCQPEYDLDGDLVVNKERKKYLIKIQHQLRTKLSEVGFQLWRASFYLMDFIINNPDLFQDRLVVELGSGLGIVSMTCALFAQKVLCTDIPKVVVQAEKNYLLNKDTLNVNNLHFTPITWSNFNERLIENLNSNYLDFIKDTNVFIAADVVYDDLLTIKLMNTLYKLITYGDRKTTKYCYISGESRINFTLDDLEETDCAYNYFKKSLLELDEYIDTDLNVTFKVTQLDCENMPKYVLNYDRNSFLYIWRIEMSPV